MSGTVTPINRRLVDVHYVCEASGLAPYTVYRLSREGRIPAVRLPGSRTIRFDKTAIDKWLANLPKAST